MSWWEILALVVICVAFAVALGVTLYNKIRGKSGCDCGGACSSCGGCDRSESEDDDGDDSSRGDCRRCVMCTKENTVDG